MNQGQMQQLISETNVWWRDADWEADDPDLIEVAEAPFPYEPSPLADVRPDGVYFLRGPRRVGKTVEVKRLISRLIRAEGVRRRRIVHYACNGLTPAELRSLPRAAAGLVNRDDGPLYFILDEITAARSGWPEAIAHMRDNDPHFRAACVVLTGSSTRGLDEAIKALADRRGRKLLGDDRLLLPMTFRAFCRAVRPDLQVPAATTLRPKDFSRPRLTEACEGLTPFLGDLTRLWDLYLVVGGLPRAVADWVRGGRVSAQFIAGLWQVIHGEAIVSDKLTELAVMELLSGLARRVGTPLNLTQLAEDVGLPHHSAAGRRVDELVRAYICWPCHQDLVGRPNPKAQSKLYFTDPLLARLAHERDPRYAAPNLEQMSEQQLGLALLRAFEAARPGRFHEYTTLTYLRTPTKSEVDFVGHELGGVAFESKYTDSRDARAAQPLRSYRPQGVMASRGFVDLGGETLWLPAAFAAWLLNA